MGCTKWRKDKVFNWHSLFCLVCCFVFLVWSSRSVCCFVFWQLKQEWYEAVYDFAPVFDSESCFEKPGRIWKVPRLLWFQVPQEFAGCGWSFPSEAGSWNHDLHWCYWGITFCIGEPWRSTSVGRWVPWLPTCWVLKCDENVTSFCPATTSSLIKFWTFKKVLETLEVLKIAGSMQIQKSDSANSLSTQFTAA